MLSFPCTVLSLEQSTEPMQVHIYRRGLLLRDALGVLDLRRFIRDVLLVVGWRTRRLLLGESTLVTLRGSCRSVGCRWGYIGEEGLVLRRCSANEVGRFFGEDVGEEVSFLSPVGDLL